MGEKPIFRKKKSVAKPFVMNVRRKSLIGQKKYVSYPNDIQ
jgi:hypothetical protein